MRIDGFSKEMMELARSWRKHGSERMIGLFRATAWLGMPISGAGIVIALAWGTFPLAVGSLALVLLFHEAYQAIRNEQERQPATDHTIVLKRFT